MTSPAERLHHLLDQHADDLLLYFEEAIRMAYAAGYVRGLTADPEGETCSSSYEDWRGFGPGHTLPGGQRYRDTLADWPAAHARDKEDR